MQQSIHTIVPQINIPSVDYQSSLQKSDYTTSTPCSTPSLRSLSGQSSSNSSVCSTSYRPHRCNPAESQRKKSSQLLTTPQTYEEHDDHIPAGFKRTMEESSFENGSHVESYDTTTECSGSPEPGVLEPASEVFVISYQTNLPRSIDGSSYSSNMPITNSKKQALQISPSYSPNLMKFQGMFRSLGSLALHQSNNLHRL
jgi:hypothetical protein